MPPIGIGEAAGAAGDVIRYIAGRDDRARAEVMWAVEQAVASGETESVWITAKATALLDYVYAEAERRHPPTLAPTGKNPGDFDTEQDSSGKR